MIRFVIPKNVRLSEKMKLVAIILGGSAGIMATVGYLTR